MRYEGVEAAVGGGLVAAADLSRATSMVGNAFLDFFLFMCSRSGLTNTP